MSTFFPTRSTTALVAALAGACVAAPGAAAAVSDDGSAGPVTYYSRSVTIDAAPSGSYQWAAPRIGCSAGQRVISGGADANAGGGDRSLAALFPFDDRDRNRVPADGWKAHITNESASASLGRVFAICDNSGRRPEYVTASARLSGGAAKTVHAPCPRGHEVASGGVKTTVEPVDVVLNSTSPFDGPDADADPDDGWRARVYNESAREQVMKVYAICIPRDPSNPLDYAIGAGAVPSGGIGTSVPCPPSTDHVLGGGVRLSGPAANADVTALYPSDDGDDGSVPEDAWGFRLWNGGAPVTATYYAICGD